MSELRLDLMVNGKKKTFIQDRVPLRKAIEYTEKQAELFEIIIQFSTLLLVKMKLYLHYQHNPIIQGFGFAQREYCWRLNY